MTQLKPSMIGLDWEPNRRILLVDDNPAIHEDYRKILAPAPVASDLADARAALFSLEPAPTTRPAFELTSAQQGDVAFRCVQQALAANRPYALAFVDMRMPPGWDGLQTIEQIWQIDPDLQIVICTAYSDHSWDEITSRFGHTDGLLVLQKPFQTIEVIQLANSLTRKWDLSRKARAHMDTLNQLVDQRTAELTSVNMQLRITLGELEHSRNKILEQNEELHRLATRDPLTGCLNRRAFFSKIDAICASARATAQPVGCLMIDIDHFKRFNDHYGHAIGDQVIAVVASHLSAALRPDDVLCRYGGEEFCAVLPGAHSDTCEQVAERLRVTIELQSGMAIRSISNLSVTASIGVVSTDSGATEAQHLINQADKAMYASKQAGRNRVTRYDRLSVIEGSGLMIGGSDAGR